MAGSACGGFALPASQSFTTTAQHYAFLVPEEDFDAIFQRIQQARITYYADPALKQAGQINYNHGGRGVYFLDPAGQGMEVITSPYGSDGQQPPSP